MARSVSYQAITVRQLSFHGLPGLRAGMDCTVLHSIMATRLPRPMFTELSLTDRVAGSRVLTKSGSLQGHLHPVFRSEMLHQLADVDLNGRFRQVEVACDFLVSLAFDEKFQHFDMTFLCRSIILPWLIRPVGAS